jgi:phosphate starvation-inducible membrane PsiE
MQDRDARQAHGLVAATAIAHRRMRSIADPLGSLLVEAFHFLALFAIGGATVWSAAVAFVGMVEQGHATIRDILLLFIYLELGAMVGIYFRTNHLPVRYLIYVAITALTRLLIDLVSAEHRLDLEIVIIAGGILLLTLAVLILRYGSFKYPSEAGAETAELAGEGRRPSAA